VVNSSNGQAQVSLRPYDPNTVADLPVADWKAWLAENPITLYYALTEPIYHNLSAEELAQYAALHTNYPSTTIYNDVDAYMEVKYAAIGG
jgi:hypothetical protein